MKLLLIILFLFVTHLHANVFQLSTIVDEQQLIPVIKINGKVVIEVKDVGSRQVFSSPFERSEKIFNTLKDLEKRTSDLNRIRIRRGQNRSDYVAYVDNVELYRVTPSDVIGSDLTVYQMAKEWRDNIYAALKTIAQLTPDIIAQDDDLSAARFPLIGFLSVFSKNSFLLMILQITLFVVIQVVAILVTFNFLNKRNKYVFDEFHKRLKKFHHKQIQYKNVLTSLESEISDINSKLGINRSDNKISKMGE